MLLAALIGAIFASVLQGQSPAISKAPSDSPTKSTLARSYIKKGEAELDHGPAGARTLFEKALELCRADSDKGCSAEAENDSGVASLRLGDVDEAAQRLQEAETDFHAVSDLTNESKARSNIGLLFYQAGDFDRALAVFDQARLRLSRRDTEGYAKVLNNLGLCYQSLAEYAKAREYFAGALAAFARATKSPDLEDARVKARLNLGRNYMLEGQLHRAQKLLAQDLVEADRLQGDLAKAAILRNLGQTLWRRGRVEEARLRLEEALALDRSHGDRRGQSSALHYLGLIAQKNGKVSAARSLFLVAIKIRRSVGLRDDAAESLYALAALEYDAGNLQSAREYAEQALKLLELVRSQVPSPALRASFFSRKRQFFDLLVEIAMAPGTPQSQADGLLAVERGRGRALTDLLASGPLLQQLPNDLEKRRANIQKRLDYLSAKLSSIAPDKEGDLRQKVEGLVAQDEEVQARIRELVTKETFGQPLSSITELQQHLPAGSALLEYSLGARHSYVWLVDARKVRAFSLPRAGAIEADARPVIESFGQILERQRSRRKQARFDRAMKRLSSILLGALSGEKLPQRLVIVPDGVLHQIPFAALRLRSEAAPLGIGHDLVQVPSAAYLTLGKQPRPISQFPEAVLAMVDPVFSVNDPRVAVAPAKSSQADQGLSLPRLPFTGEVRVIESLVPRSRRKILRGFDASREELDKLKLEDFAVLHFSTHALIDDQIPELSRVVLSMVNRAGRPVDGFLGPYQFAHLHLNGAIVVLSACDTALGKQVLGEGLAGLTSSLLYAGGSQLVLTITEVDAEASSYFLGEVYRRFLSGSSTMEHAITETRRVMARSRRFSDPFYWASFIVVGRPADTATGLAVSSRNKQ